MKKKPGNKRKRYGKKSNKKKRKKYRGQGRY